MRTLALIVFGCFSCCAQAQALHVYGPGGPAPAMKEAAALYGREHGVAIQINAGPAAQWEKQAAVDADVFFSGAENMMSDFIAKFPDIDAATVRPLYLRPSAILVRPGNPKHIRGVRDLVQPGLRLMVVNGAGQTGLWEDVAGRSGDIETVRSMRRNIAMFAPNSGAAKDAWQADRTIDAWLIWNIWQVANPELADLIPMEPEYRIYRDAAVALTRRGARKAEAAHFAAFLESPAAAAIFRRWGWLTSPGDDAAVNGPRHLRAPSPCTRGSFHAAR